MALVEQAVFTSAETDRSAGYHVVAASPGVCESDVRELAVWGASHDSLFESGADAVSVNFHPLPSGAYCVSRTTPSGWEYSGRGGYRVYTHCLVVPPKVLARFANNAFAVMQAAVANGAVQVHEPAPSRLEPLALAGGAAAVDQDLLARLAANPGPQPMVALVQAALDAACLAVAGPPSAALLIAGLISCLPPECRTEFSFSTGLKFTSRRPFRIMALSGDPAEQRWVAHQNNVSVLNLSGGAPLHAGPIDGWARLIGGVLSSGRTSLLAAQLSRRRCDLTMADLPALGLQLLEDLDDSLFRGERQAAPCEPTAAAPEGMQRAHAAHHQFDKSAQSPAAPRVAGPSLTLEPDSPEVLEKLEHLDDVVFEAICGMTAAMEELRILWPALLAELGEELVSESREQYLRYALRIWDDCVDARGVRDPARAMQALDVLSVLFDGI
jgi:hypothetical protein